MSHAHDSQSRPCRLSEGNVSRRRFLRTAAYGAAGLTLMAGCPSSNNPNGYPNVLLIMVDQMRLPKWFPASATLPGYERLCSEGTLFSNFFTSAVPCSASRATIFTGLHQPQHEISTNVAEGPIPGDGSLDPRIPTLGHVFQDAGYRTPYFGKWHLTESADYEDVGLSEYGFEEWEGPDAWGLPLQGTVQDEEFIDQAIQWLRCNGRRSPWFMTCSLVNPHDVMYYRRFDVPPILIPDIGAELPGNFNDTLEGKPEIQKQYRDVYGTVMGTPADASERVWREYLDYYYFLTRRADDHVGRLLDALDRMNLADDTLVIFISDHGEMAGSHQLQSKGPYVYQENNLVPLVVRWPGRVPAGAESQILAQTVDFFPTLAELAGIPANTTYMPGKSLAQAALGLSQQAVNDHVLMVFPYSNSDDFTQLAGVGPIPELTAPMLVRGIFDGRYKFARYFDHNVDYQEYELYDLLEDPLEMENKYLDPSYETIGGEMADRLQEAETSEMTPVFPDWLRP